jgi:hypothetical protein
MLARQRALAWCRRLAFTGRIAGPRPAYPGADAAAGRSPSQFQEMLMQKLAVALVSLLLALPGAGRAEDEFDDFLKPAPRTVPESGLSLGVRAGYGIPLGSASGAQGAALSKYVSRSVPLQIEGGWRFSPKLYAGAYFQYAFASTGSLINSLACGPGVDCSGSDLRFGVDVIYTFLPRARIAPWVGVGAGYEIMNLQASEGAERVELKFRGFEFGHLMAGADYRLWPNVRVGLFTALTFAQFSTFETPFDENGNFGPLRTVNLPKAFHEWLQFGVRTMFDF